MVSRVFQEKMDIKKDKKGMVVIQGSEVKAARNSKELYSLFEEGSKSRHVASTSMLPETCSSLSLPKFIKKYRRQ